MKASEMRIRNWFSSNGKIHQVSEIWGERGIIVSGENLITNYEPIPLTEEWLEKFGFEKGGKGESSNFYYLRRKVAADFIAKPNGICWFMFRGNQDLNECTYVHQL